MKINYTENEDQIIIDNYKIMSIKEISKLLPNRTIGSIKKRAFRLGANRQSILYTKDEDTIIIDNYNLLDKDKLLKLLPNRDWNSVYNRAFKLNIKRDYCQNKLINLLQTTHESYYWFGFLIADGHFSKHNVLHINIIKSDIKHLMKFCEFLNLSPEIITIKDNIIRLIVSDANTVRTLKEKYNIKSNKTYTPIKFDFNMNKDYLYSFLIGLIDGDGYITKRKQCKITAHKNWSDFYNKFNIGKINYTNNTNVLTYNINGTNLCELKKIINKYKLPILNRKWDKINIENKYNKLSHVIKLFNDNLTKEDILKNTNYTKSIILRAYYIYKKELDCNFLKPKEEIKIVKQQFLLLKNNKTKYICDILNISIATCNRWKRDAQRELKG